MKLNKKILRKMILNEIKKLNEQGDFSFSLEPPRGHIEDENSYRVTIMLADGTQKSYIVDKRQESGWKIIGYYQNEPHGSKYIHGSDLRKLGITQAQWDEAEIINVAPVGGFVRSY